MNLSSLHLVHKGIHNIPVISSYSMHSQRNCFVPFATASPDVRWSFIRFIESFLRLIPSVKAEPTFFTPECLVSLLSVSKHSFCSNPLIQLSRSLPISDLSSLLFVMSPYYISSANSIRNDFKFSFRSSTMFKSLGRWTALSSLSAEIHVLCSDLIYNHIVRHPFISILGVSGGF